MKYNHVLYLLLKQRAPFRSSLALYLLTRIAHANNSTFFTRMRTRARDRIAGSKVDGLIPVARRLYRVTIHIRNDHRSVRTLNFTEFQITQFRS